MEDQYSISAATFKELLDDRQIGFILDLREEDEFAEWRIEGVSEIETVNIPKVAFVGEEEQYFDKLPRDKRIYIICAHGDSSKYSAKFLEGKGFKAVSLAGGMDAWSDLYETHRVNSAPDVYQILRVARGCITHVIVSGGQAVVVDPIRHIAEITKLTDALGASVTHVIDTHLQADHISGGKELAQKTGAKYCIHPADAEGATFGCEALVDGHTLRIGASTLTVLHTPGHTVGSTSLLLDAKYLFAGDTILKDTIGRPDLGGMAREWAGLLYETLFGRFAELPDDTVIFPSHASAFREQGADGAVRITLGDARREGDLYAIKDRAAFIDFVQAHLPKNPERYAEVRKVNLGLIDPDEKKRRELEIGKNLCGMAAPPL